MPPTADFTVTVSTSSQRYCLPDRCPRRRTGNDDQRTLIDELVPPL